MPVYRKKVDGNQGQIVGVLKTIPGVTVEVAHDDILVGYRGRTYWFEVKSEDAVGADGKVRPSEICKSQKRLLATWTGHYEIVWSLDQILRAIGVIHRGERDQVPQAA